MIDFDVHHGNGTQDILCKTHDPRFLYISMHAGTKQAGVGYSSDSDVDEEEGEGAKKRGKDDDIFPGKCGDKSPHKGVLNIPMGPRVTAAGEERRAKRVAKDVIVNDFRNGGGVGSGDTRRCVNKRALSVAVEFAPPPSPYGSQDERGAKDEGTVLTS